MSASVLPTSSPALTPAEQQLDRWWSSPKSFVLDVFQGTLKGSGPDGLEFWQADVLEEIERAILANLSRDIPEVIAIAIRSGHGPGKSTLFAWLILWFNVTRKPAKTGCTAPTEHQLSDILWAELAIWHKRLPDELRDEFRWTQEKFSRVSDPEEGFAVARVARKENPEAFQGLHSENMLLIADEASGIDEAIYEAGVGALSTPGAIVVLAGNPTQTSGFFYDCFHKMRHRWRCWRVNSEDVPRARGHIQEVIDRYGKESNAYRVRVLGEFPTQADEQVVSLAHIEAANARRGKIEPSMAYRPVWGVDVARFGNDDSALAKRRGNALLEPVKTWHGKDTMQLAGLIAAEYNATDVFERPSRILVDVIGIGAGVVDRLRELELPARGVNVAESPAHSDRFMRLRDELWWKTREWYEAQDAVSPDDPSLTADLTAPTYSFTSSGKIVVESKEDTKKRLGRSPDRGDAVVLTMAGGTDRMKAETLDRYRRKPKHKRASHWAA